MAFQLQTGIGKNVTVLPGMYATEAAARKAATLYANRNNVSVGVWDADLLPYAKAYKATAKPANSLRERNQLSEREPEPKATRKAAPKAKAKAKTKTKAPPARMSKLGAMSSLFRNNPLSDGSPYYGEFYYIDDEGRYQVGRDLKALTRRAQALANATGKRFKVYSYNAGRFAEPEFVGKMKRNPAPARKYHVAYPKTPRTIQVDYVATRAATLAKARAMSKKYGKAWAVAREDNGRGAESNVYFEGGDRMGYEGNF